MRPISADGRVFWRLAVAASSWTDGYAIAIAPDQFEKFAPRISRGPGHDVVDLVCEHIDEIMARGERTWLDDQGIDRGFGSY